MLALKINTGLVWQTPVFFLIDSTLKETSCFDKPKTE